MHLAWRMLPHMASVAASPSKTRVLLIDDNQMIRTLIRRRVAELNPTWEIYEVQNGSEALAQAVALKPDIALLDLSLPDMLGESVARGIRQVSPITKIVLCSLTDESILLKVVERIGADAFISKTASNEEFHATLTALIPTRPNSL
jgi:DNA-binding NarL/FixJ family response regulator